MKQKLLTFMLALLSTAGALFAQNKVTGTVTDDTGYGVIGASVMEKGTQNGVITDLDGNFEITVRPGATLVFSSIGYATQEVVVGSQRVINVLLKEDAEFLDEVVVVGYGTMKRSDLSGASVSMKEEDLKGSIISSLDQSLQGRAAGVLLPFRHMSFRARAYISWVGLKGAGPILFALYPVVEGMQGASLVFNVVFCVTLISLVVQGMTLTPMARWLKLAYDEDPEVETFGMDMPEEMGMLRDHVVGEEELTGGGTLRDLHLPHGIRVVMVRRDGKYLVPHGSMVLHKGDHLIIVMGESDD